MNFIGFFLLLIGQYFTGRGVIQLLKFNGNRVTLACFSLMAGVGVYSFIPFFLELGKVKLTTASVGGALAATTLIFMVPLLKHLKTIFSMPKFNFRMPTLYEVPFYAIFIALIILSIWRCYYLPPNARDMTSGPGLMAKLAMTEKSFINSIFSLDLQSTNNYLKPPFIISLQIIYQMFACDLGQLWLSVLFVAFTVWLFSMMVERIHPLIACIFFTVYMATPELYAYTYMVLFDFPNMVYFAAGFYFLSKYLDEGDSGNFNFAAFLFTVATYVRTETPILLVLALPLLAVKMWKDKVPPVQIALKSFLMMIGSALVYLICMNIYVKHYIPIKYDVSNDVNKNLANIGPLFTRLTEIVTELIFSPPGMMYYGYFFHIFLFVLAIDLAVFRKLSKTALYILGGVAVVYVGLALVGFILPLADLMHTTKRGMFKILPIIMMYYAYSPFIGKLSSIITNWEGDKAAEAATTTSAKKK